MSAVIIRPKAEADLQQAHDWYEKKQVGLGGAFLACVDETFEKLKRRPDFGILVHKQLRRANVRRFP